MKTSQYLKTLIQLKNFKSKTKKTFSEYRQKWPKNLVFVVGSSFDGPKNRNISDWR